MTEPHSNNCYHRPSSGHKMHQLKFVFCRGSAPDPAGEAHDAPQTPSRLGSGHPLPIRTPLGAYGASILAHTFGVRLRGFLAYITSIPYFSLLAVITLLYFCNVQNNSESEQLQCL